MTKRKYGILFLIFPVLCLLLCTITGCFKKDDLTGKHAYYSDYFVFIGQYRGKPLVIPIDINWEKGVGRKVFREIKAWWIDDKNALYQSQVGLKHVKEFPEEWLKVPAGRKFGFGDKNLSHEIIRIKFPDYMVSFRVDDYNQYVEFEDRAKEFTKLVRGHRQTIVVNDFEIEGFLVYEHIRSFNAHKQDATPKTRFGRFTWIPLVTKDHIVLFINRNDDKLEFMKWDFSKKAGDEKEGDEWESGFVYEETGHVNEEESGRTNVPVSWILKSETGTEAVIKGTTHHTGYGEPVGDTKPLYRQQLAEGTLTIDGEDHYAFGMIELILDE